MSDMIEALKKIRKNYPNLRAAMGEDVEKMYRDYGRTPTGIFGLDYALGGGVSIGNATLFWGKSDSMKSTIAAKTLKTYLDQNPDKSGVLLDTEGHQTFEFLSMIGLGPAILENRLAVINVSLVDELIDINRILFQQEDIGMIVVDSLGQVVSSTNREKTANKGIMAGESSPINRLLRAALSYMGEAKKTQRPVTLICITHAYQDQGGMYPVMKQSGGDKQIFSYRDVIQFSARNETVGVGQGAMPATKIFKATVKKHKGGIMSPSAEFNIYQRAEDGHNIGDQCDEQKMIFDLMLSYNIVVSLKKGFEIFGEKYGTQKSIKDKIAENMEFRTKCIKSILSMSTTNGMVSYASVEPIPAIADVHVSATDNVMIDIEGI